MISGQRLKEKHFDKKNNESKIILRLPVAMYPTLDDASTIRASNDTDSRQAQHTNLTPLAPSSTSSATGISTITLKKRLRAEDFSTFLDNETVEKAVTHLSLLNQAQIDNLTTQNTPGQEIHGKATVSYTHLTLPTNREV